ncbi:hypothetical protein CBER1_01607 [Cercospora berteroae]|uniref:Methyltransferase domain-containing protein n=1 Tax=Cercospora berteroae TaxID=357750 RepID=A0A2S6C7S3_9PEZI|nr:hypothetical protein CBER1_01607 [Cercospora berteroae]
MSAFTEANRKAFDDLSATYDTKPWQRAIKAQVAEALIARKDWIGAEWATSISGEQSDERQVRLLDYACGTGAVTQALLPYVNEIRGIDISENMVKRYNEAATSSGLQHEQAHAVVGDLLGENIDPAFNTSEWHEFDVAVIGLGFHHFEDPEAAIKRLAARLKASTGVLLIVDFLPFDHKVNHDSSGNSGSMNEMAHTIKHNGFTGDQMRDMYQAAGFEDFDIVALKQPARMELSSGTVHRTLFIAKGRKSATVFQKIGNWLGSLQGWAAGDWRADRRDHQHWQPGFANDVAKKEGSLWGPEKLGETGNDANPRKDEPFRDRGGWNMGLPRHNE